ncbi:class I SAM-dependent methyltransferase [Thermohalobacter berrensis]|uniref:Methyltransferase type 11 n=1 Tax=Thermohalobacter berrensis TaxID=99594 RepID=A0A419T7P6_9FIRM|nr:class I SAM-dependent methyltransferase [Thermohalobacter berrensis]RKD33459.1 methyltransferase type 11 [Thermohalobacter berrensis]
MELSPKLYHWFVRPKWFIRLYNNTLKSLLKDFDFKNKKILDFGCGIGSSSSLFDSNYYLGLDCDSKRINYAKYLYPNYNFSTIKKGKLPLASQSIDYILIIAVLHHISTPEIKDYLLDFHRILKHNGKIIIIEPCIINKYYFSNWFMTNMNKGKYIRNENDYLSLFNKDFYDVNTIKKFKKCFFYNEIFFTATKK